MSDGMEVVKVAGVPANLISHNQIKQLVDENVLIKTGFNKIKLSTDKMSLQTCKMEVVLSTENKSIMKVYDLFNHWIGTIPLFITGKLSPNGDSKILIPPRKLTLKKINKSNNILLHVIKISDISLELMYPERLAFYKSWVSGDRINNFTITSPLLV